MRLLKSILKHGRGRNEINYDWEENPGEAHVVLVNAESNDAVLALQGLQQFSSLLPVMVLGKGGTRNSEYVIERPIAPVKVMGILEKIFHEKLASILEESIFKREHDKQQAGEHKARATQARRVLVVDDSPTVRKQLEMELAAAGIAVDSAENGEQVPQMLDGQQYDLVFLDIVLPGVDGYEVCRTIKKNQKTKQIPVILLTSKSSSFDKVRGAMAGCSSYLTKPVDYEKFHKVLSEYLLSAQQG